MINRTSGSSEEAAALCCAASLLINQTQSEHWRINQTRPRGIVLIHTRTSLTYTPTLTPPEKQTLVVAPYILFPPNHHEEKALLHPTNAKSNYVLQQGK